MWSLLLSRVVVAYRTAGFCVHIQLIHSWRKQPVISESFVTSSTKIERNLEVACNNCWTCYWGVSPEKAGNQCPKTAQAFVSSLPTTTRSFVTAYESCSTPTKK